MADPRDVDDVLYDLTRTASKVLTRGRVLVEEDAQGSHQATALEVPIEAVRALAASVEEARAFLAARLRDAA